MFYKSWGNKNSPKSLNIMVNYDYHGKNRIFTCKLPSVGESEGGVVCDC